MKVMEAISWLRNKVNEAYGERIVIISTRQASGPGKSRRVIGISMDDSDNEVHLLVNHAPWDEAARTLHMTAGSLLIRLIELPPHCESYRLVSGTWHELDEEHVARLDWPLEEVVTATTEDGAYIAFIERQNCGEASDC